MPEQKFCFYITAWRIDVHTWRQVAKPISSQSTHINMLIADFERRKEEKNFEQDL